MGSGCSSQADVFAPYKHSTHEQTTKLTLCKDVYCWGSNTKLQLGLSTNVELDRTLRVREQFSAVQPHRLLEDGVVAVSCGTLHSALLTRYGTVYTCGEGKHGRLGHGFERDEPVPRLITSLLGIRITQVACGNDFTLVLTSAGKVYSFGAGHSGQLGVGAYVTHSALPCQVDISDKVVQIAAGLAPFAAAVCFDGRLFTWGVNANGELGHAFGVQLTGKRPTAPPPVHTPTLVRELSGSGHFVVSVHCGYAHMCAVLKSGKLFVWGEGRSGQLGQGRFSRFATAKPIEVEVVEGGTYIVGAACGGAHTIALTSQGEVFAWGNGQHGQLGTGDTSDQMIPVLIPTPAPVRSVSAGMNHTVCTTIDGRVMSWGLGSAGQLGNGSKDSCKSPALITTLSDPVMAVSCGASHSIAVVESLDIQIATHLSTYVCSSEFSDVRIRSADGTELPTHLCILAVRCPELYEMVSDGIIECDIATDALRHVLCYLYTDDVPQLAPEDAPLISNAATDLILPRLERLCSRIVRQPMVVQDGTLAADIISLHDEHMDATVRLSDGTSRKGHAILLARIRTFKHILVDQRDFTLDPDMSREHLNALWQYAYRVDMTGASCSVLMHLIPWARASRDTALVNACVKELVRSHVTVDSACDILMAARANTLPTVVTHCKQFIKAHDEVRNHPSYQQLPEELQQELAPPPPVPVKPPTPRDMRERRLKVNLRLLQPSKTAKDSKRTAERIVSGK